MRTLGNLLQFYVRTWLEFDLRYFSVHTFISIFHRIRFAAFQLLAKPSMVTQLLLLRRCLAVSFAIFPTKNSNFSCNKLDMWSGKIVRFVKCEHHHKHIMEHLKNVNKLKCIQRQIQTTILGEGELPTFLN